VEQTLEIVLDQLMADEEFRDAFIHMPRRTLSEAADWGVPLCDSEILALVAAPRALQRIADQLNARLHQVWQ
jgi:hypothetical protein